MYIYYLRYYITCIILGLSLCLTDTTHTPIYTLSLHDALPISSRSAAADRLIRARPAQIVPKPTGRGVCAPISTYASAATGTTTWRPFSSVSVSTAAPLPFACSSSASVTAVRTASGSPSNSRLSSRLTCFTPMVISTTAPQVDSGADACRHRCCVPSYVPAVTPWTHASVPARGGCGGPRGAPRGAGRSVRAALRHRGSHPHRRRCPQPGLGEPQLGP